jgi:parallel beta-helix repeat protein
MRWMPIAGTAGKNTFRLFRSSIVCTLIVSSATSAAAATWVVDNNVPPNCPKPDSVSIQVAVANAMPGDKILVCPGTYGESVLVNKNDLRIEAQGKPGDVILQGTPAQLFGFHLLNTSGVVLQGFTIQGFNRGNIRIDAGSGNTVRNNITARAVVNDGIQVVNSSANVIEHNTSFENGEDGIFVGVVPDMVGEPAFDNIIRHNQTHHNRQIGINLFQAGRGNTVFGNTAYQNRVRGISTFQTNEHVIENNYVFENGLAPVPGVLGVGVGIAVVNSTGVTVKSNRSERNGANGIGLNGTTNSVATNNRSESNRSAGINLNNAAVANLVEKNQVFGNGDDGIRLQGVQPAGDPPPAPLVVANNTVQLNLIRQNGRDGIRASALTVANAIERNVIRESGEHDAHDDSVGPFPPAFTANEWVNNKCETENRLGLCDHPDH